MERHVNISYQRIYAPLRDRIYFSLGELNAAIAGELQKLNGRPLQGRGSSRYQVFTTEEKPLLRPLPPSDFTIQHQARAKVQRNYHVTLGEDWVHYSVPYIHIGQQVIITYDSDRVEIFLQKDLCRIATHGRSYRKHSHVTLAEHMPEGHRHYATQQGYTPEYFLERAAAMGTAVRDYISLVLESKSFTQQTFNACLGILRLEAHYGAARLEAACTRALQGRRYNYKTVAAILENNKDKEAETPELFRLPGHENIRGAKSYQ